MDYKKIYDDLVEKCVKRGLDKKVLEGYYEKHHIIPKCLGGTDKKENFVLFTPREHVIAHRLLWKANPDNYSLMWAYTRTVNSHKGLLTSREVEKAKITKAEFMSNRVISDETKEKISKTLTGRKIPREIVEKTRAKVRGQKRSQETKDKLRSARRELIDSGWTMPEEARKKIGDATRGKKRSPEAVEKSRLAQIGKKLSEEHKKVLSDRQKSLLPWERSKVVNNDFRRWKWENADFLLTYWEANNKVGSWAFSTIYNSEFNTSYSVSYFTTIVDMFREGWIPTEDENWLKFKESF